MATGSILFLGVAIVGLILLIVGVIFLIKNLKWKKEKDAQGISSTINIVAMVLFGLMSFLGLMWFLCFGLGSLIFTFAI